MVCRITTVGSLCMDCGATSAMPATALLAAPTQIITVCMFCVMQQAVSTTLLCSAMFLHHFLQQGSATSRLSAISYLAHICLHASSHCTVRQHVFTCNAWLKSVNSFLQEELAEQISLARAALRPWARGAEKQASRVPLSPQAQLTTAGSGKLSFSRQLSKTGSSLGSPLGSSGSGRGIDAYLARSTRDGDVPEIISQVGLLLFHLLQQSTRKQEQPPKEWCIPC